MKFLLRSRRCSWQKKHKAQKHSFTLLSFNVENSARISSKSYWNLRFSQMMAMMTYTHG